MKLPIGFSLIFMLPFFCENSVLAQDGQRQRFNQADSKGVVAYRDTTGVYLEIEQAVEGSVTIPRLAAPWRAAHWSGDSASIDAITLKPEPDEWIISWTERPKAARELVIIFDAPPLLIAELEPVKASSDGSIYLPAHLATTSGEKIRYEPQTFKNTVGYWVGRQDSATWRFLNETPGQFNVAILQGCGSGQGGSQATLSITADEADESIAEIGFRVHETGHFQNFQWRHLGEMEIGVAGAMELKIAPDAIRKNALMDVRAVHLVRLPAPRKVK